MSQAVYKAGSTGSGEAGAKDGPIVWQAMALHLWWGTVDKGMVRGGANQEPLWDIKVSSSRTDTHIFPLPSLILGVGLSRSPGTVCRVNTRPDRCSGAC